MIEPIDSSSQLSKLSDFVPEVGKLLYHARATSEIVCVARLEELDPAVPTHRYTVLYVNALYHPFLRPAVEGEVGIDTETGIATVYHDGQFCSLTGRQLGGTIGATPVMKIVASARDLDLRWRGVDG